MKKLWIGAGLVGTMLCGTAPASADAFFFDGVWYFFTLNFEGKIAKLTGADINDGTIVETKSFVLGSQVACVNPQTKVINPGEGPYVGVSGVSEPVGESDAINKSQRQKRNEFTKTATSILARQGGVIGGLPFLPNQDQLCKNVGGNGNWIPVYWQDKNCKKLGVPYPDPDVSTNDICYSDLVTKVGESPTGPVYQYISSSTQAIGSTFTDTANNWTYVFLPILIAGRANLQTGGEDTVSSYKYYKCSLELNTDSNAAFPGQPHSLTNPPAQGWASKHVKYSICYPFTEQEFNKLLTSTAP